MLMKIMKFKIEDIKSKSIWKTLGKNKNILYGIPFITFLVVGSFGLSEFTALRYEFRSTESMSETDLGKLTYRKSKTTLEEEYKKYQKEDLDAWENIRGPRPYEEETLKQQRTQIIIK